MSDPVTETPVDEQGGSSYVVLSERDAEKVLADILNPPPPNPAALEAARKLRELHG